MAWVRSLLGRRHGWQRAIALCLAIALGLAGCQSSELRVAAAQGSQIVLATLSNPKTFNYALNQEFPSVFLFTYEGLTAENGETGAIEPALAESWTISEDGLRVRFRLREGLRWSDGEPLTADDVVFTYQQVIFNPDIPTDGADGLRIGAEGRFPEVQKRSDREVEFRLPEPFAPLLRTTIGPPTGIAILPRHALEAATRTRNPDGTLAFLSTWSTGADPRSIVTSGPYVIDQYVPGQRVIFRRNPHYWRRDPAGQPLPYIDRVVWQIVESTDTQLLRFRSGDLDVMGDTRPLRPEYFALLRREEARGNFQVYGGGPWSGTTFLSFNLNQGRDAQGQPVVNPVKARWFQQKAFRQAVAYAIDRRRMLNNVFRGLGELQDSPVSFQSPYFLSPDQGLKTYDYDPAKAKALLEAAGFRYGDRGELLDSDGNRVQFTLLTNSGNKIREAIGSQIRSDLAKIGMRVDFTPIDFNALTSKLTDSRDWDAHLIGFTGSAEPHSGANLWTSGGGSHVFNLGPQPGQPPLDGWQPYPWEREIDRLFTTGAQELDEAKRRAIYGEFQQIVQEELPVIHLVAELALMAGRDRLDGVKYSSLPTWGLWNLREIKIKND